MSTDSVEISSADLPYSALSLRTRKFFRIWRVPPDPAVLKGEEPNARFEVQGEVVNAQWCNSGAILAVTFQNKGLVLYTIPKQNALPGASPALHSFPVPLPDSLKEIPTKQLKWIAFSPKGTYLSTFWLPGGQGLTELSGANYFIWRVELSAEGMVVGTTVVFSERYKNLASPGPIQWRDDEVIRVFTRNGQLQLNDGHDFADPPLATLPLTAKFNVSIAPFCASEPDAVTLTMFAPADQGIPESSGKIRVLFSTVVSYEKDAKGNRRVRILAPVKVAAKDLNGVDGCEFLWSPSGRVCIMMTSTLVDAAGNNYGLVGDVWLCEMSKERHRVNCAAVSTVAPGISINPLPNVGDEKLTSLKENMDFIQNGSIELAHLDIRKVNERVTQDAKWSPTADEFILIEGKAPSDIYLYDGVTGEKVHTFAKGYKNQIVWNKQGDMVAIGGFGNLAGDLSFYHRDNNRNVTLINEWRESCTVLCDWSPCGRYFFTASVRPRMMVDNQIKLWNRDGCQLLHIQFDELYAVEWKMESDKEYSPLPVPRPYERTREATPYKPRNWGSNSQESQILARYHNGDVTEADLPEDLRKRMQTNRAARNNGLRSFDKSRFGGTDKACDTALDWRASEPVSEECKNHDDLVARDCGVGLNMDTDTIQKPGSKQEHDGIPDCGYTEGEISLATLNKKDTGRRGRKEQGKHQASKDTLPVNESTVTFTAHKEKAYTKSGAGIQHVSKGNMKHVSVAAQPLQPEPLVFHAPTVGNIEAHSGATATAAEANLNAQYNIPQIPIKINSSAQAPQSNAIPTFSAIVNDVPVVGTLEEAMDEMQAPALRPRSLTKAPKNRLSKETGESVNSTIFGGVESPQESYGTDSLHSSGQPLQHQQHLRTRAEQHYHTSSTHRVQMTGSISGPSSSRHNVLQDTKSSSMINVWNGQWPEGQREESIDLKIHCEGNFPQQQQQPRRRAAPPVQPQPQQTFEAIGFQEPDCYLSRVVAGDPARRSDLYHKRSDLHPYDSELNPPAEPDKSTPTLQSSIAPPYTTASSPFLSGPGMEAEGLQNQNSADADISILSLLQSILPSHAKIRVKADTEDTTIASKIYSAPQPLSQSSSLFMRCSMSTPQAQPSWVTSTDLAPPGAGQPDDARLYNSPMAIKVGEHSRNLHTTPSSKAVQQQMQVAYPHSRFVEGSSDRERISEREQEQAHFIQLIKQAGLQLPNLVESHFKGTSDESIIASCLDSTDVSYTGGKGTATWNGQDVILGRSSLERPGKATSRGTGVPVESIIMECQHRRHAPSRRVSHSPGRPAHVSSIASSVGLYDGSAQQRIIQDPPRLDASLRDLLKELQRHAAPDAASLPVSTSKSTTFQMNSDRGDAVISEEFVARRKAWSPLSGSVPRKQQYFADLKRVKESDLESHKQGHVQGNLAPKSDRNEGRRVWQYVDPKGMIQGSFTRKEMRAWWERGYFAENLPVRRDSGSDFVTLREMFPDMQSVFFGSDD